MLDPEWKDEESEFYEVEKIEKYIPISKMLTTRIEEFQWVIARDHGDVVVSFKHLPTGTTMRAFGQSEELVKKVLLKLMDEIFVALEAQTQDLKIQELRSYALDTGSRGSAK